jgi:hypothetical protein
MGLEIDSDPRLRRDHGWRHTREPDDQHSAKNPTLLLLAAAATTLLAVYSAM